jgi:hypothetical protein
MQTSDIPEVFLWNMSAEFINTAKNLDFYVNKDREFPLIYVPLSYPPMAEAIAAISYRGREDELDLPKLNEKCSKRADQFISNPNFCRVSSERIKQLVGRVDRICENFQTTNPVNGSGPGYNIRRLQLVEEMSKSFSTNGQGLGLAADMLLGKYFSINSPDGVNVELKLFPIENFR